jgi:hypothetical protein
MYHDARLICGSLVKVLRLMNNLRMKVIGVLEAIDADATLETKYEADWCFKDCRCRHVPPNHSGKKYPLYQSQRLLCRKQFCKVHTVLACPSNRG